MISYASAVRRSGIVAARSCRDTGVSLRNPKILATSLWLSPLLNRRVRSGTAFDLNVFIYVLIDDLAFDRMTLSVATMGSRSRWHILRVKVALLSGSGVAAQPELWLWRSHLTAFEIRNRTLGPAAHLRVSATHAFRRSPRTPRISLPGQESWPCREYPSAIPSSACKVKISRNCLPDCRMRNLRSGKKISIATLISRGRSSRN